MSLIVNPGSGAVPTSGNGWENTYEQAKILAAEWYERMTRDGLTDIELLPDDGECVEGRWTFRYRHNITGVVVKLETHGLTDDGFAAYEKERLFGPRVYWNGSSIGEPQLEDWAAPGFTAIKTYAPGG